MNDARARPPGMPLPGEPAQASAPLRQARRLSRRTQLVARIAWLALTCLALLVFARTAPTVWTERAEPVLPPAGAGSDA